MCKLQKCFCKWLRKVRKKKKTKRKNKRHTHLVLYMKPSWFIFSSFKMFHIMKFQCLQNRQGDEIDFVRKYLAFISWYNVYSEFSNILREFNLLTAMWFVGSHFFWLCLRAVRYGKLVYETNEKQKKREKFSILCTWPHLKTSSSYMKGILQRKLFLVIDDVLSALHSMLFRGRQNAVFLVNNFQL